uniref:Uncharacterized protein n=1 Tax=Nelumbo nucifera TaxID=4432 RepID=A0A822Y7I9_NELNU|nr:TPA_asm: hypothetical protein HUJ06_029875 [Nelumbo nucifera]
MRDAIQGFSLISKWCESQLPKIRFFSVVNSRDSYLD